MALSLRHEYVCVKDFRALNRPFEKGQTFPLRRYRRIARMLLRRGLIAVKTPEHTIEVSSEPGEGPFVVKHRGGGRWAVVNAAGEVITSTAPKAFIAALAEQMNAPGEAAEAAKAAEAEKDSGEGLEQDPGQDSGEELFG